MFKLFLVGHLVFVFVILIRVISLKKQGARTEFGKVIDKGKEDNITIISIVVYCIAIIYLILR